MAVDASSSDSRQAAKAANLRYVTDIVPGITRVRRGRGFSYHDSDGTRIIDKETLSRIRALAIPPAWHDVWIAPTANAHIQATGRDDKGRKQYRYHPRWRAVRDEIKYDHVTSFGHALPAIRRRVKRDLSRHGLPQEKVVATVVALLEATLIRIGNEEYARENKSYGLTTMRNRHVDVGSRSVRFHFRGKSGQYHEVSVSDRRIATIVKRCRELPGQELFQYVDDDGERCSVTSGDVNEYLHEITCESFSAKDFRTWAGTVLAADVLQEIGDGETDTDRTHNIVKAIEQVAEQLGNTPAVCRKCYVHPGILNAYLEGSFAETIRSMPASVRGLSASEARTLAFLERRASRVTAAH
jgi:DNA topoisomerase-1